MNAPKVILFSCMVVFGSGVSRSNVAVPDLTRASSTVVLVTVLENAVVFQPEKLPTISASQATAPTVNMIQQTTIGSSVRVRVDEVFKNFGRLAAGEQLDVYDSAYGSTAQAWAPLAGQQYVLYLRSRFLSADERPALDPVARKQRIAPSVGPIEVQDVNAAYTIVDPHWGGAVLVSVGGASKEIVPTIRAAVLAATGGMPATHPTPSTPTPIFRPATNAGQRE